MNTKSDDREILIKHRLLQAEETISDVQLLIENNRLRSALNRIYYGMFYSLLALALAFKYESSKHAQILGWFNKNFINKGLIDQKFGKIIYKAFSRRTKGDYDTFADFEMETVVEMFKEMQEFVAEIKSFLTKG